MDPAHPGAVVPGSGAPPLPSSSSAAAAAAAAEVEEVLIPCMRTTTYQQQRHEQPASRYESQKRRDWNTFLQYLDKHKPPLTLPRCGGAHVVEFLEYLDQFGKTKVHAPDCAHFGRPAPPPPPPCACPLRQAWGSLDALIGRLRAAYEEKGGIPEANPFGAMAVRAYLREVRVGQAKARGIPYEKKRKRQKVVLATSTSATTTITASGDAYSNTKERYCNL